VRRFEESLVATGIAAASVVLFINVVLRYFFNSGWTWAEEFTRYTIVWIVFIGGSICVRKGMHLAVDALAIRFSESGQRLLRMFVDAVCVLFCVYLIRYGYEAVLLAYEAEQITAALEMPMHYVYLAIPVGGFLMAIRFTQDFFLALRGETGEHVTEAG
jgi:C4-dicarboxylate transporter DctQ subunit